MTAELSGVVIPKTADTDEKRKEFLYRAIECCRLEHNKQRDAAGREKCLAEQQKYFSELNKLRDLREANEATNATEKAAGKIAEKWDVDIDLSTLRA